MKSKLYKKRKKKRIEEDKYKILAVGQTKTKKGIRFDKINNQIKKLNDLMKKKERKLFKKVH